MRIFLLINGAMFALQVAAIANEKYGLQWTFTSEKSSFHKPPRQIEKLFDFHSSF